MTSWYAREILSPGKQPLFVLFVAFVVTFLFIRFSTRMIRAQVKWWPGNVSGGGVHLHHVVFGIVFMLVAGAGGFSALGNHPPWAEIFAGLFGCGAALVLDEFALVLHLRDVYWSEQGRTSVDAIFLAIAVFGLLLTGATPFGADSAGTDQRVGAWSYVFAILPNLVLVVITLAKGKVWTGLIGILFPLLVLVGTFRLARPTSAWARWRYKPGSRKLARAEHRDDRQRAYWIRVRNRLQDALAGRPS
jgi:hypothetical protein